MDNHPIANRDFPMSSRQVMRGYTYLPIDKIHNSIMQGLTKSIRVTATEYNCNGRGCICEVQSYLARSYGGPPERYTQRRINPDEYIIQLPDGLPRSLILSETGQWGLDAGWELTAWDPDSTANHQPEQFKIHVSITNFLFEFWHPKYVQMVTAQFGELYDVDDDNMWGEDRSQLAAHVTCIDPRLIPFSSTLPYDHLWKECYFEVYGWEYIDDIPPGDRYEPYPLEDTRSSLLAAHDRLLRRQGQRSPPPSDASSSAGSQVRDHDEPVDQLLPISKVYGPPPGTQKDYSNGTCHNISTNPKIDGHNKSKNISQVDKCANKPTWVNPVQPASKQHETTVMHHEKSNIWNALSQPEVKVKLEKQNMNFCILNKEHYMCTYRKNNSLN